MEQLSATVNLCCEPKMTERIGSVMKMFGLNKSRLRENALNIDCRINISRGQICYITGPSGSGKSVLLERLCGNTDEHRKIRLEDIPLERGASLIDCIEGPVHSALKVLSRAGLSDVFSVLNEPARLSEGQKYRYRLARALASGRQIIFADEFCSNLDRIAAAVISHNIRKTADASGRIFVLASAHDDLLIDLQPDVTVIQHLTGKTEVTYKQNGR